MICLIVKETNLFFMNFFYFCWELYVKPLLGNFLLNQHKLFKKQKTLTKSFLQNTHCTYSLHCIAVKIYEKNMLVVDSIQYDSKRNFKVRQSSITNCKSCSNVSKTVLTVTNHNTRNDKCTHPVWKNRRESKSMSIMI